MIPIATLLGGYRTGYFPMAVDGGVRWFSPGQRGVIPLDRFRATRRLARMLRQRRFRCAVNKAFRDVIVACASRADPHGNWINEEILESYCLLHRARNAHSVNRSFRDVITACASREDTQGNWIDADILESYCALHHAGHAHSVEVWDADRLAGGLYGVNLRGAFFGESMFHRVRDTSKVALCCLVSRLRDRGYRLLDVQWITPHLRQFGAVEIPRSRFLTILGESMQHHCEFDEPSDLVRVPSRLDGLELQPDSSSTDVPA